MALASRKPYRWFFKAWADQLTINDTSLGAWSRISTEQFQMPYNLRDEKFAKSGMYPNDIPH
jgi:hypothetical protein